MSEKNTTPILIASGQFVSRSNISKAQHSPADIAAEAIKNALQDAAAGLAEAKEQALHKQIDTLVVTRLFADSSPFLRHPFGKTDNFPGAIAKRIDSDPKHLIYADVGGQSPQRLVNEMAEAIHRGERELVVLAGAEASDFAKQAKRQGIKLDWTEKVGGEFEDRGYGKAFVSNAEMGSGVTSPTQVYPLFENAWRNKNSVDIAEHRNNMGKLFSRFAAIAAENPYAQFPTERSPEFLATTSAENYDIALPYTKWLVAQDAVNQGAAVIMTSVAKAQALGIPESQWIYLHGYADVDDLLISERKDLASSAAMALALQGAMHYANINTEQLALLDLYSCFPCAVIFAAEALGIDWMNDTRDLTVTGGLPFFGGAGNNYSMHAIAEMVQQLRDNDEYGLVLANGGFLSKQSVGIYSRSPAQNWSSQSSSEWQNTLNENHRLTGNDTDTENSRHSNALIEASIESYTISYNKGQAAFGYVTAIEKKSGSRKIAKIAGSHRKRLQRLATKDCFNENILITGGSRANYFRFDDEEKNLVMGNKQMRTDYEFCRVEIRDHVLEVTLNRPEARNALHPPAHEELTQIWDDYARNKDLWVAILTGAGDKAFCSGNDLKYQASGKPMFFPATGFAGLCGRNDLDKPIIAAVNGFALGGGCEIALVCDIVVAAEHADFGLPEVKVGLIAAGGGLMRLPQQLPTKIAKEMALTGEPISAQQASEMGLVNHVVSSDQLITKAREIAEKIANNSPTAVRLSKRVIDQAPRYDQPVGVMQVDKTIMRELNSDANLMEGVKAFAQKRPPKWTSS